MIVSIIALSTSGTINEAQLDRNLERLDANINMPTGPREVVLKKMEKQGYIVRSREQNTDDPVIEYRLGPRAKLEIGTEGVMRFVKEVYGDDAPEDLEQRLYRSLGVNSIRARNEAAGEDGEDDGEHARRRANSDSE